MKVKSTKSALLMSFTSLLLCFAMLIGTTFAWFTDSVTSGVNKIVAGNLDVEVEYSKDGSNWADLQNSDSLFTGALWEPGHTEVVYLRVKNAGTLALKYDLKVSPVSESGGINVEGDPFKLSDYIKFGTTAPAESLATYERDTARAAIVGNGASISGGMKQSNAKMLPGAEQYMALVVYMPETVGNEANYKTGTAAPFINLGITVLATQVENEKDSFDENYDKDLTNDASVVYNYFPQVTQVAQLKKSASASTAEPGGDGDPQVTAANDKITITSAAKVGEGTDAPVAASVTFRNNAVNFGEATTATVTLDVKKVNEPTANITVTDTQEKVAFDVNVTITGADFAKTEGNFTSPMEVTMFIGKGKTNLKLYHGTTEMSDQNPGAADTFTYDPNTGVVTMYVNHFSEFTAVYDEPVAAIGTTAYYSLESAVAAAKAGETVTLLKDVTDNVTISAGKAMTLNLNGKTINGGNQTTANNKAAITNNGTLTLTGNGTVKREDTGTPAYYVIANANGATMTIENATVTNNSGVDGAGSSLVDNAGTMTINNLKFTQANFIVIKNEDNSKLTINGGEFNNRGYYTKSDGTKSISSAVQNWSTAVINGGKFSGGISTMTYGSDATTTINGGEFKNCSIWLRNYNNDSHNPSLKINGGTFEMNADMAFAFGADKSATKAAEVLTITGGTFSVNPIAYVEAPFYVSSETAPFTISKCTSHVFSDGVCTKCGAVQPGLIATQEMFETACAAAAVSGDTITLGEGKFAIGPVDINGKTLTFKGVGADKTTVYIGNGGYDGNGGHGSSKTANMTFENLTLDDLANDSGYLTGFTEAAGLTFRNVTFNFGFSNWGSKGGDVSFYNCTFNQNNSEKYNVQGLRSANGTKYLFDGCVFNSAGRFINAYKQGGKETKIFVTVKDCTFNSTAEKYAAVYLKNATGNNNDGCSIELRLNGTNTVTGTYVTDNKTGSPLYGEKGTSDATVYVNDVLVWENSAKVTN